LFGLPPMRAAQAVLRGPRRRRRRGYPRDPPGGFDVHLGQTMGVEEEGYRLRWFRPRRGHCLHAPGPALSQDPGAPASRPSAPGSAAPARAAPRFGRRRSGRRTQGTAHPDSRSTPAAGPGQSGATVRTGRPPAAGHETRVGGKLRPAEPAAPPVQGARSSSYSVAPMISSPVRLSGGEGCA
jgi:hypothetical protein